MSGQTIRLTGPEDTQALAYVLMKMFEEEQSGSASVPRGEIAERLKEDGPGGKGLFECLLGFHRMRPSGFLMFTTGYDVRSFQPAGQVQLIYVTEAASQDGLAEELVNGLFQLSAKRKWGRINWPVDRADSDAISFFTDQIGATCENVGFAVPKAKIDTWLRGGNAAA